MIEYVFIQILLKSMSHSSEKRALRSTFWPRETLQNLLCLRKKKTQVGSFFCFSFVATLSFTFINALVYVDIDQGIHKGKMKVALNEKQKKLHGFSFSINIANFEAFLLVLKLTKNPLFPKSGNTTIIAS